MIYTVRHLTRYRYARPVGGARCVLRLRPRDGGGQRVISTDLEVSPSPDRRIERVDFFGLRTISLTIDRPHGELTVEARSRVAVDRPAPESGRTCSPWEAVRDLAWRTTSLDSDSPAHFLHASRRVSPAEAVTAYARDSFAAGRPIAEAAFDLMGRIRRDFRFDGRATHVGTPLAEAFAARRGVCQDFAHIMVAGLRGLGLPAGYVSGYLRTIPPPGVARLRGADASHAWVAVWDGAEWFGLDPTNGIGVGEDHIELATGRDYSDVSPVDGFILSSGPQRLQVEVDVIPDGET